MTSIRSASEFKGPVKLHVPATGFARQDIYILPELLKSLELPLHFLVTYGFPAKLMSCPEIDR
jgi:hypothetical protein